MNEGWVRSLRDQCIANQEPSPTPFFYKQNVVNGVKIELPKLDGKVWNEFPAPQRTAP